MPSNAIQNYVNSVVPNRDKLLAIQSTMSREAVDGIFDERPLHEAAETVRRLQPPALKLADSGSKPSHHALYEAVKVLGDTWEQFVESVLDAVPGAKKTRNVDADIPLNQAVVDVQNLISETPRATQKRKSGRRRNRNNGASSKPLTAKQTEAIKLHGECDGNIAEVARRMGIGRKTAEQHIDAAFTKLGKQAPTVGKTKRISEDKRGQANVSKDDDKRR